MISLLERWIYPATVTREWNGNGNFWLVDRLSYVNADLKFKVDLGDLEIESRGRNIQVGHAS